MKPNWHIPLLVLILFFAIVKCSQADTLLVLALKHQNIEIAQSLLENEIANPHHPNYGQYLTQEEIRDIIQPSQESQKYIKEYIKGLDAYDITITPTNDWISCKVPMKHLEKLQKDELAFNNYASPLNLHLDVYRPIVSLPSILMKTTSDKVLDVTTHITDEETDNSMDIYFSYTRSSSDSINFVIIPFSPQKVITKIIIGSSRAAERHSIINEVEFSPVKEGDAFQCSKCSEVTNQRVYSQFCSNLPKEKQLCFSNDLHLEDFFPILLERRTNLLVNFYTKVQFDGEEMTEKVTLNNDKSSYANSISVLFESDQMDPNTQRSIYGTTAVGTGNTSYTQMIWGSGSYGYSQR